MPFITIILFGALSASFALIIELLIKTLFWNLLMIPSVFSFGALAVLLGIASIEELSKYIFLKQYAKRFLSELLVIRQGVVLGISFGIGFAAIEILLMFYTSFGFLPLEMALSAAALHILTSVILTIYFLSLSQKTATRLSVIALVILLHMLYNTFVIF